MEYSKATILQMKELIKTLSLNQKSLKNQRKTEHFTGTRTIPAWQAAAQHLANRSDLRYYYLAYGIMRGKAPDVTENKSKEPYDENRLQKILERYAEAVRPNS